MPPTTPRSLALLVACTLGWSFGLGTKADGTVATAPTICSITLNSDEEIHAFQTALAPQGFRFVELTDFQEPHGDWFGAACRSGIECDVLLISGHFGGAFFGASGLSLSLQTLEAHSCQDDCSGILSNPSEVFLMGCNTAASKARDRRTPAEYFEVLLEDGVDRRVAERIVESRYGSMGTSIRSRMQRVFSGVPHLYGFRSIGPAGDSVVAPLTRYLESQGSYRRHLARLGGADRDPPNRALARSLRHTSFSEYAGVGRDAESATMRERICSLYDEQSPIETRLGVVETMVDDPQFLAYVPSVERFLDQHPPYSFSGPSAEAAFERLKGREGARHQILRLLEGIRTPYLRTELARLARALGWVSGSRFQEIAREAVRTLFSPQMGVEEKDIVCSLAESLTDLGLRAEDLTPAQLENRYAAWSLVCLAPEDERLHPFLARALDDDDWRVRLRTLETLARLAVRDARVQRGVSRVLRQDGHPAVRAEAARTLAELPPASPSTRADAMAALGFTLGDPLAPAAVRAESARSLGRLRPLDADLTDHLLKALADADWQVQFSAAEALGEIGPHDPRVLTALREALDASSWFVRYKVTEAIRKIRPGAPSLQHRDG